MDLSGNALSSQVSSILELKFLKKLNLARNSISVVWELPKSLEQLNLSENFVSSLEFFIPQLSRLQRLDVTQNCIGSLKPVFMLNSLKSLYAGKNKICDVEGIFECKELVEIDIECNCCASVDRMFEIESLAVANIKGNPCFKNCCSTSKAYNFSEQEEGILYRNLDKTQLPKGSKFKIVGKKVKKIILEQKKRSIYRSRLISMQEICNQVISEDPEMESLSSSEGEEKHPIHDDFKKPQVSKLQLDKINDSQDKISSEKWSTKPEISIDHLLDDLVHYCDLEKDLEKTLDDDLKLETIFRLLKNREDERKFLLREKKIFEYKIKELKKKQMKNFSGSEIHLNNSSKAVVDELCQRIKELQLEIENQKKAFLEIEAKMKEKIRGLEDDRFSSRVDFYNSYDGEFTECRGMEARIEDGNVSVPVQVAEYIQNLLKKISRLVGKNRKLSGIIGKAKGTVKIKELGDANVDF